MAANEDERMTASKDAARGVYYGYNYYLDAEGRFVGEERAGSNAFYFFPSREVFEEAVSAYNVVGRVAVKSASTGRA